MPKHSYMSSSGGVQRSVLSSALEMSRTLEGHIAQVGLGAAQFHEKASDATSRCAPCTKSRSISW